MADSVTASVPHPDSDGVSRTGPTLRTSVGATAQRLQAQFLGEQGERNQSAARGTLAELRRDAGLPIDKDPLALGRVVAVLSPPLSEGEIGHGDAPTASEKAAFHALTLFAVHMQGATRPVHRKGESFASACGRMNATSASDSLKPRFDAMLVARHARSQLTHMRSLVTLLRAHDLSFDYGQFAQDLRSLSNPERRSGVLLRWGRDFVLGGLLSATDTTDTSTEKEK